MSYDAFGCAKVTNRYELEESNIFHAIAHNLFDKNLEIRPYFKEVSYPIIQLQKLKKNILNKN